MTAPAKILVTSQEKRLMEHLSEGASYKAIAQKMGLSVTTVYSYSSRIMSRLGVRDHRELALIYSKSPALFVVRETEEERA